MNDHSKKIVTTSTAREALLQHRNIKHDLGELGQDDIGNVDCFTFLVPVLFFPFQSSSHSLGHFFLALSCLRTHPFSGRRRKSTKGDGKC